MSLKAHMSLIIETAADAKALHTVAVAAFDDWLAARPAAEQAWLKALDFKAKAGACAALPDADGGLAGAVVCLGDEVLAWDFATACESLPDAVFRLTPEPDAPVAAAAVLGWALAGYRFGRYKQADDRDPPRLVWPEACDRAGAGSTVEAISMARDLINTPAGDLGPAELAEAARATAEAHGAEYSEIVGDELLEANYPLIHAVGRASSRAPRLIDFSWGAADAPRVTLVGKGVCFDSGGLDLKPSSGMELMKKDMGGAAVVLGLAQMIMAANLPLRLRVLIPAVENAVSGNAFRPGDILSSRKGLSVEIGNTDAEGRLVLADALAEAATEEPDLLIDYATLTGAARVALGPELPAFFTEDDELAQHLSEAGLRCADPLWRLPLWQPYREFFKSPVADINNAGSDCMGGAITAALFLESFTEGAKSWVHLDLYAWNKKARPGRPVGGEGQAMRALFETIERFIF